MNIPYGLQRLNLPRSDGGRRTVQTQALERKGRLIARACNFCGPCRLLSHRGTQTDRNKTEERENGQKKAKQKNKTKYMKYTYLIKYCPRRCIQPGNPQPSGAVKAGLAYRSFNSCTGVGIRKERTKSVLSPRVNGDSEPKKNRRASAGARTPWRIRPLCVHRESPPPGRRPRIKARRQSSTSETASGQTYHTSQHYSSDQNHA